LAESKNTSNGNARDIDIVMMARMVEGKGHMLLKDALIRLGDGGRKDLNVHVCGSGPIELEVKRAFAKVEGQRLNFYFEQEPFQILRRTRIYVSLQDVENYPSQSLLEAMACGCAIVATDVGMTRQLLDESCAVLVPRDPIALAKALDYLLSNYSVRDSLGSRAKEVVTSTQTIERFSTYFLRDISRSKESVVGTAEKTGKRGIDGPSKMDPYV